MKFPLDRCDRNLGPGPLAIEEDRGRDETPFFVDVRPSLRRCAMAEGRISWRRDAEDALEEAKRDKKKALVDFTAAPM